MKTIGYIRVSTDEQAKNGLSLPNQEEKIKAYTQLNNLPLDSIYIDDGETGSNLDREGIQEIMHLSKEKAIKHIITCKLDRLTRNTRDLLMLVDDIFTKNGVELHSIQEKIDTSTPQGKFCLTIMGAMAQMERDLISERTKEVLQFKKSKGQRTGNIPYGKKLARDRITLIDNISEEAVISSIKNLRATGLSLQQIANTTNSNGYRTRTGGEFRKEYVHRILKNNA
jgi:DNA invertase Pin-like site-specific DNA recombinase